MPQGNERPIYGGTLEADTTDHYMTRKGGKELNRIRADIGANATKKACYANSWAYFPIYRYDDLIREETPVVQQALKRLPPKLAYDRVFRIRRALHVRFTL